MDVYDGVQTDIWVYDFTRNTPSQITFDPGEDGFPVWTPDGERIVYRSNRGKFAFDLFWQRSDSVGQAEPLTASRNPLTPDAWHPSGQWLAYNENNPTTGYDMLLLPIDQKGGKPSGPPEKLLVTSAQETMPAFSPDGRWMAYVSNEAGRNGVYVRPFRGSGGLWLAGPDGRAPVWSRTRKELVYVGSDNRLMITSYVVEGDQFRVESTRPWASVRAVTRSRGLIGYDGRPFDLHPDGNRALGAWIPETAPLPVQDTVVLGFNFFDELKRLAPPSR